MASITSETESLPKPAMGNPVHLLAFGFGAGCSPKAPGTMGTLLAVGIYLPLSYLPLWAYGLTVLLVSIVGIALCGRAARDLGVHDEFEIIVAGDTLPQKKPDPTPLLYAAEQLGIKPENALMVGDSQSDVKAARAAGFQIVCMSYGYNHGEDIRNYNPDAVIDTLTEIRPILESAA